MIPLNIEDYPYVSPGQSPKRIRRVVLTATERLVLRPGAVSITGFQGPRMVEINPQLLGPIDPYVDGLDLGEYSIQSVKLD